MTVLFLNDKGLALVSLRRQIKALKEQDTERTTEMVALLREYNEPQLRLKDTGVLISLTKTDTITYRDGGVTEAAKIVAKAEAELAKAKALLKARKAAAEAAGKFRVTGTTHGLRVQGL